MSVTVENTGQRAGDEVVQRYLRQDYSSVARLGGGAGRRTRINLSMARGISPRTGYTSPGRNNVFFKHNNEQVPPGDGLAGFVNGEPEPVGITALASWFFFILATN